jgi:putative PIN family toxin of toxin-antitoxin system
MRIVADTNTLVSGFGWGGAPSLVVDAILAGRLTLVISPPLRDELDRVLRYPKLAAVFPEPERITALLTAIAEPVEPPRRLAVLADEPDNRVLEAAVAGQAEVIVTGDAALLELREFEGIAILNARQLADLLAAGA